MVTVIIQFNSDYMIGSFEKLRRQQRRRWIFLIMMALGLILLALVGVAAMQKGDIFWSLLVVGLIVLALCARPFSTWRVKRACLKSPFMNQSLTMEFTESDVHIFSPMEDTRLHWDVFTEAVYFQDGILLFKGPGFINWIPYSSVSNVQQIEELRNLFLARIPKQRIMN